MTVARAKVVCANASVTSTSIMKIAHIIASTTEPNPNSMPRKFGLLLVTCTAACKSRKATKIQASTMNTVPAWCVNQASMVST